MSPRCRLPLFPNETHLSKSYLIYIDRLSKNGVEEDDRKLLDRLYSRVSDGDISDDENDGGALNATSAIADEGSDKRPEFAFLFTLLRCVYNRTPPANTKSSDDIKHFINKVKDVLPVINDPGKIKEKMDYPASSFLRSAAVTMATAMKRHYRKGSQELVEKALTRTLMDMGHLSADMLSRIDSNIPAIENFVRLNKITEGQGPQRAAPKSCAPRVSEHIPSISGKYVFVDFDKAPGYLVTTFLTDVGGYDE
ncbi:hypothetical protein BGZ51_008103, partial [Haplosporangium sp. Z 767]